MAKPSEEFDRVLTGADPVQIELARGILEDAGIPCLEHGPDFDMAELGRAAHDVLRHQDLFVPRGQGERALDLLEAAWGRRPDPTGNEPLEGIPPSQPDDAASPTP
jgi:hypothetical protein